MRLSSRNMMIIGLVALAAIAWIFHTTGDHHAGKESKAEASQPRSIAKSDVRSADINPTHPMAASSDAAILAGLQAGDGPGATEMFQARAWDVCGRMQLDPSFVDLELKATDADARTRYRRAALERLRLACKNLPMKGTPPDGDDARMAEQWMAEAAKAGNVQASAHELARELHALSPEEAQQAVLAAVQSGDPAAIYEIARTLGPRTSFAATPGGEVGASLSSYAWQLVACDQGMDCSANSWMAENACVNLGACGPGDFRDNLRYTNLPPARYAEVLQIENRINLAIAHGTTAQLIRSR